MDISDIVLKSDVDHQEHQAECTSSASFKESRQIVRRSNDKKTPTVSINVQNHHIVKKVLNPMSQQRASSQPHQQHHNYQRKVSQEHRLSSREPQE